MLLTPAATLRSPIATAPLLAAMTLLVWRTSPKPAVSHSRRITVGAGAAGGGPHRSATDPVIRLLDRVVHCVAGGVDGRGYLLSCLPLARRAAWVLVRTLRSLAARYGPRAGRSLLAFRGL